MSPHGASILPQIWTFFIVALPLFAYARSADCAITDSTCSNLDAVPAAGEALLQRHAKLESSILDQSTHVKSHLSHSASLAQRTAIQNIATLMALIGETGSPLPRGATELFNDQLCKVKPDQRLSDNPFTTDEEKPKVDSNGHEDGSYTDPDDSDEMENTMNSTSEGNSSAHSHSEDDWDTYPHDSDETENTQNSTSDGNSSAHSHSEDDLDTYPDGSDETENTQNSTSEGNSSAHSHSEDDWNTYPDDSDETENTQNSTSEGNSSAHSHSKDDWDTYPHDSDETENMQNSTSEGNSSAHSHSEDAWDTYPDDSDEAENTPNSTSEGNSSTHSHSEDDWGTYPDDSDEAENTQNSSSEGSSSAHSHSEGGSGSYPDDSDETENTQNSTSEGESSAHSHSEDDSDTYPDDSVETENTRNSTSDGHSHSEASQQSSTTPMASHGTAYPVQRSRKNKTGEDALTEKTTRPSSPKVVSELSKVKKVVTSHQAVQELHKSRAVVQTAKKAKSVVTHPSKQAKKLHASQIQSATWPTQKSARFSPAESAKSPKLQEDPHSIFRSMMVEGLYDDNEPIAASIDAPLDETGYRQVLKLQNDDEMKVFIRRVAQSCNMKVIDEGGLNGIVPFLSGTSGGSSFDQVKATLFAALLARSQDHWVSVKNSTEPRVTASSAPLDLMGYVQVRSLRNAAQMVTFVKRMVESMGIKIVDKSGFNGLMGFYSEPDDSESFQKLVTEIKKAAYEHSWAEIE